MKEATANTIGNVLLTGSIITSGASASAEKLNWVQQYYSELMFGVAIAGLVLGAVAKYYAHQLNRERLEFEKLKEENESKL